jgi:dihydrofolate reductase/thymidylate synthase
MNTPFSIIVAVDQEFGIGKEGVLPWDLPGEIKHFREVTIAPYNSHENVVIMGRKTWDSIPHKFRPLPKRINLVLTRHSDYEFPSGVLNASGLDEALMLLKSNPYKDRFGKVFVIGGSELFQSAINHPECRDLYLTHIDASFSCDRFFPSLPSSFKEVFRSTPIVEKGLSYFFSTYQR